MANFFALALLASGDAHPPAKIYFQATMACTVQNIRRVRVDFFVVFLYGHPFPMVVVRRYSLSRKGNGRGALLSMAGDADATILKMDGRADAFNVDAGLQVRAINGGTEDQPASKYWRRDGPGLDRNR
jgi:hypothetical protein